MSKFDLSVIIAGINLEEKKIGIAIFVLIVGKVPSRERIQLIK